MPKCLRCGKKGFFLRLNSDGICLDCFIDEQERKRMLKEQRIEEQRQKEAEALNRFREIFPVTTANEPIQKLWSWYPTSGHDQTDQLNRQKRIFEQAIPIYINTKFSFAYFLSTNLDKIYDTDLFSCTCPDFSERQEPCKHMYRLFYELTHEPSLVPEIIDVDSEVIDKFLAADEKCRTDFISTYCMRRPEYEHQVLKNKAIQSLIGAGLLTESTELDYLPLLKKMTKDEIILSLAKRGVSGFASSWSKVKLIDWVVESQQQYLRKQFKDYIVVSIDPSVIEWAKGIKKSNSLKSESLMLATDALLKNQNTLDIFKP